MRLRAQMASAALRRAVPALMLVVSVLLLLSPASPSESTHKVLVITVSGIISPVSAEFIVKKIAEAEAMNAEALVIELDTPGGLDTSMRTIVKEILASSVPVIVYVYPSGARDASAGVFITMAAHIAAMAPGTNIGAAHPVSTGGKMDKTMADKVTNDAAAYIKSIAERTGRNAKWAEEAVRKSVSITETEALELHVIDLVSPDLKSLLSSVEGRKVITTAGEKTLRTEHAEVVTEDMGWRYKILNFISDPSVAYMLMLLGFYGIFFELTNPGSVFPGVAGAIFLILAFYSFQTLPVNYAGLLFILLGLVLFILEVKVVSHGVLTIGGIISMVIGSLMLFDSPAPFFRISIYVVLPVVIVTAIFFTVTFQLAYKAFKRRPVTGGEGLVGLEGKAATDITREGGLVSVRGELWSGYAESDIRKGDAVTVESLSGLTIKVRKKEDVP